MSHSDRIAIRGMTLLEVLASIAVLAVLASILTQTFISTLRLSKASNTVLDRMRETSDVRELFTKTVREAGRVVEGVGEYKTGPDRLVLELPPDQNTDVRRYTVLGVMSKDRLGRMDWEERNGTLESTYLKTCALPVASVRFITDQNTRLVSMEVDAKNAAVNPSKRSVTYRYGATMRSILAGGTER